MKPLNVSLVALLLVAACRSQTDNTAYIDTAADSTPMGVTPLPDTAYASTGALIYTVELLDTTGSGQLADLNDAYAEAPGHLTFRGGALRDEHTAGSVVGTPSKIVHDWTFQTDIDDTKTVTGTWGGGSGWTGQPVYVSWSGEQMAEQRQKANALTADFGEHEIIVGSLCGRVYFINYDTGRASREPLNAGNPIKGSVSLDPSLNGTLYVGQGIPAHPPIGHEAFNIFTHEHTFFYGPDPKAERNWGAFDSSPLVVGQYLFWPGENGTIYKYVRLENGSLRIHSKLRYHLKNRGAAGVENSLAAYRNYGFFGDNHGNILCINLQTLHPVWLYEDGDDIDGSLVCEVDSTDGTPYIYAGCEVDQQGRTGLCRLVKLNAFTGQRVWEQQLPCNQLHIGTKHFDGGLYCTPLLGHGDCEGKLFASICQTGNSKNAEFICFDRSDGTIVYRTPLDFFAWSSPVPFYNERGELFIVTGDSAGHLYLIRGATGEILFKAVLGNNFESTPVAVGNTFVVGSRGQEIHRFHIE